jgi:hypothetical protein
MSVQKKKEFCTEKSFAQNTQIMASFSFPWCSQSNAVTQNNCPEQTCKSPVHTTKMASPSCELSANWLSAKYGGSTLS